MLPLWVVRAFRKFQARFGKGPYAEGSGPGGQTTSKDLQAGVRRANARPTRRGSTEPASTERFARPEQGGRTKGRVQGPADPLPRALVR